MEKTKIGIMTICKCNNYGAELQAYATQAIIRQMGCDPEIIDYIYYKSWRFKDTKMSRPFMAMSFIERIKYGLKYRVVDFLADFLFPYFIPVLKRRKEKFSVFHQINSKFGRCYKSMDELYKKPPQYNVYMTGSDQVWNPSALSSIEPYFLSFAPKGTKKVSYAASFGISELPAILESRYKKLLSEYDYIGVREKSGCDMVKQICGMDSTWVLDPTLLLSKKDWNRIGKPYNKTPKQYVLIYQLSTSQTIVRLARQISKEKGIPVLRITKRAYCTKRDAGIRNILDAGPEEFVSLISGACVVLTNSFHGTAFSINMEVPFWTFISPHNSNNSRIKDLLELLGLQDRMLRDDQNIEIVNLFAGIDFKRVMDILMSARNKSVSFLRKAIVS